MTTILRPLSTSELLDRTFHLYKSNFLVFLGIAAIPQVGVFALRLADALWARQIIVTRGVRIAVLYLAGFVAIEICHAATVNAVSDLHLGRGSNIWSAYASAKNSLLRVIGITLVAFALPFVLGVLVGVVAVVITVGLMVGLGLRDGTGTGPWIGLIAVFLILVAGPLFSINWWIRWSLVVPVTVLEGGGLRTSMRRSSRLTEGRRWRLVVIYLLVFGLTWIVVILLQTPFYSMVRWRSFLQPASISKVAVVVAAISNFVSQSLVSPLLTIACTLIYYDERVRREGFDLQLMMSPFEKVPPPAADVPLIS